MSGLGDVWRRRLPEHWEWAKLRTVALLGTGHTPDRSRPEYWVDCDVPWVTAADLSTRPDGFAPLTDTQQKISRLGVANSAAVIHPAGTVMLCRTASVGLYCITGAPMATTQAFVTWTPGPTLDGRYLLYVTAAMAPEFERLAYGSTHLTIYMPDLEGLHIPLPPLDEQRRIADFLDDQVARIEEAVRHRKSQRRWLSEAERGLLDEELLRRGWELPSGLDPDWESVRPPHGWRVARLARVLDQLTNGYVGPTRDILQESGVKYLQSLHIKSGKIDFSRRPFFVSQEWHRARPRISLQAGDVLIVQTGDLGQVAMVPDNFGAASCHALLIARARRNHVLPSYLTEWLRSHFGRHSLLSRATGALHPHLEGGIRTVPVLLPPPNVQNELVHEVTARRDGLVEIETAISRQMHLLEERKRALITAAVTGEFDVSSAGSRAAAAVTG